MQFSKHYLCSQKSLADLSRTNDLINPIGLCRSANEQFATNRFEKAIDSSGAGIKLQSSDKAGWRPAAGVPTGPKSWIGARGYCHFLIADCHRTPHQKSSKLFNRNDLVSRLHLLGRSQCIL
jgi:hypothetical protein